MFFLGDLPFSPHLTTDSAQMSEIILTPFIHVLLEKEGLELRVTVVNAYRAAACIFKKQNKNCPKGGYLSLRCDSYF